MPLYEYQCQCGKRVEVLQKVGASAPYCGACAIDRGTSVEMKKTVSRTSFYLRGEGWAKDNYGLTTKKGKQK
tara:strand:+ start:488 stop:703 length:216 start_codon:yes stop_codon:yes gene_type:complete